MKLRNRTYILTDIRTGGMMKVLGEKCILQKPRMWVAVNYRKSGRDKQRHTVMWYHSALSCSELNIAKLAESALYPYPSEFGRIHVSFSNSFFGPNMDSWGLCRLFLFFQLRRKQEERKTERKKFENLRAKKHFTSSLTSQSVSHILFAGVWI